MPQQRQTKNLNQLSWRASGRQLLTTATTTRAICSGLRRSARSYALARSTKSNTGITATLVGSQATPEFVQSAYATATKGTM